MAGWWQAATLAYAGYGQAQPLARHQDLTVTMVGHATLLTQTPGANEPRWFMQGLYQNTEEAAQGLALCGAPWAIGQQWGVFQLTHEAQTTPPTALQPGLAKHQITADRFRALAPGET